jgi:hypothetical protein
MWRVDGMSGEDGYKCTVCYRKFKTRRMFYICTYCTAITCKACIGKACNSWEKDIAREYLPLVGQIKRLENLGFDMKVWKK